MVLDGARQLRAPPDGRREDAALNALDVHERGLEPRDEAPIHAPDGAVDANYRVACSQVPESPHDYPEERQVLQHSIHTDLGPRGS